MRLFDSFDSVALIVVAAVVIPVVVVTTRSGSAPNTQGTASSSSFYVVPLGTDGGLDESDLSSYLLTSVHAGQPNSVYVALDGGTIRYGVK